MMIKGMIMEMMQIVQVAVDNLYFLLLLAAALVAINRPSIRLLAILLFVQSVLDAFLGVILINYAGDQIALFWFPTWIITESLLISAVFIKSRSINSIVRCDLFIVFAGLCAILLHVFGFVCKIGFDYQPLWVRSVWGVGTQLIYWLQLAAIYATVILSKCLELTKMRGTVLC